MAMISPVDSCNARVLCTIALQDVLPYCVNVLYYLLPGVTDFYEVLNLDLLKNALETSVDFGAVKARKRYVLSLNGFFVCVCLLLLTFCLSIICYCIFWLFQHFCCGSVLPVDSNILIFEICRFKYFNILIS